MLMTWRQVVTLLIDVDDMEASSNPTATLFWSARRDADHLQRHWSVRFAESRNCNEHDVSGCRQRLWQLEAHGLDHRGRLHRPFRRRVVHSSLWDVAALVNLPQQLALDFL
jgi:hypothetical protein